MAAEAKKIFQYAVSKGQPNILVQSFMKVENRNISILDKTYPLEGKNVHLVGFGKAAIGMAEGVLDVLEESLQAGVLIVPFGTTDALQNQQNRSILQKNNGRIAIFEGAKNNEPDLDSENSTKEILNYVRKLDARDLLIVLVSGGASALLCAPISPVTLEEKRSIVHHLASRGAKIEEMNIVRRQLSSVKGGLLGLLAQPAEVVSFILSDIVGDPLDLVGSGPTVMNTTIHPEDAWTIIEKYQLQDSSSASIQHVLKNINTSHCYTNSDEAFNYVDHVHNYLVGNNNIVVQAAMKKAKELGFMPYNLSNTVCGEAKSLGKLYAYLTRFFLDIRQGHDPLTNELELSAMFLEHGIKLEELKKLICIVKQCDNLAVVSGGETVVNVVGDGKGGRNQECALSFCINLGQLFHNIDNSLLHVVFLSAGTDGIDGPTEAAGAVAYREQGKIAIEKGYHPEFFLLNNDSNSFYKMYFPDDLIVTGLTGTNLMDLHLLLFKFKTDSKSHPL